MKELRVRQQMQEIVDAHLAGRDDVSVLEAGCGSTSYVQVPPSARVTGVDISAQQLERNARLFKKIQGDIQAHQEPPIYDLVVCWDVLEHLDRPEDAISRLAGAVVGGGLLILKAPEYFSFKGRITRHTPHWFHVGAYRWLLGDPLAGVDGRGPFPTPFHVEMSRAAVLERTAALGFDVALDGQYDASEGPWIRSKRLVGMPYSAAYQVVRGTTGGRWPPSEYLLVLRKRETQR